MEALNKKERSDTFASFLVFYLISVALLLLAVFFAYQVPEKENELLRNKLKKYDRDFTFMNYFSQELDQSKILLDSMIIDNTNSMSFKARIQNKIEHLQKKLDTDSLIDKKVYQTTIQTIQSQLNVIGIYKNNTSAAEQVVDLQKQLLQATTDLNFCRQQASLNYAR